MIKTGLFSTRGGETGWVRAQKYCDGDGYEDFLISLIRLLLGVTHSINQTVYLCCLWRSLSTPAAGCGICVDAS